MPFVFRTHQRLTVSCPVTYELGNFHGEGTVANLSVSGIRFLTSTLLHPGQVCSMTITLPNKESVSVATGIVKWICDGNDETHFSTRKFDYGVEILMADVCEKQQLMKFLSLAGMKKRAA